MQASGAPNVTPVEGVIGEVCIGMSNSNQECGDFINRWKRGAFAGKANLQAWFVNCAVGGVRLNIGTTQSSMKNFGTPVSRGESQSQDCAPIRSAWCGIKRLRFIPLMKIEMFCRFIQTPIPILSIFTICSRYSRGAWRRNCRANSTVPEPVRDYIEEQKEQILDGIWFIFLARQYKWK